MHAVWHWSQPLAYLWVLGVYRCTISEEWYQYLAALVAARELVYLATTVLAICFCPVFLLLDPVTSWREAEPGLRALRVACYVLTPHNYVALCLANKFRSYRVGFLMLASVQVLADFSSCFTLVLALVNQQRVTALVIGYSITATSFIFFFAPMSIMSNLAATIRHGACLVARMSARVCRDAEWLSGDSRLLLMPQLWGSLCVATANR
eukprot:COSAG06_NODE_141_length_22310_cov_9.973166_13_plen_208_part_00